MRKAVFIRFGLSCAAGLCLLAALLLVVAHFQPPRATERLALAALSPAVLAKRENARMPVSRPSGPVNVNVADGDGLCALTGVGPALAERIIREREQNGPFAYAEDLLCVNGIGQKTLDRLAGQFSLD